MIGNKDGQRTDLCEYAHTVYRADDSIDLQEAHLQQSRRVRRDGQIHCFSLEGSPHNRSVVHHVLGQGTPGNNTAFGKIPLIVHHADDIICARASAFDIVQ